MGSLCPRAFSSFTTLLFLLAERTDFIQFSRLASKISRQNRALIDNILLLLIQYFIFSFMSNLLPPASRSSHRLLRLLLLWLSIGLGFPLLAKPSNGSPAAGGPTAQPLQQALNADGTLRSGATGSFDPRGYRMVKDQATGKPAFRPTGTGDEKWQDGFGFPGTDGEVSAVVRLSSGNLIVGGSFTAAGSTLINYIAKWNGSSWSSLGTGFNGSVNALAVDGSGNVYTGGAFTQAGGTAASNIAKWNGTSWSSLGSGVNSTVYAIAIEGSNNVYVGGNFSSAGAAQASFVAKWDGTSWSGMGSRVSNTTYALAVDASGSVYVGSSALVGIPASDAFIAKWDGTSWSALGTGLSFPVYALAMRGSSVAVGGSFTKVGDNSKVVARFGIYNTAQAPTVSALSPNSGPVGMPISITGTNLTGATTITFTGTSGNTVTSGFTVNAAGTQITGVVVPAGAQTGNVTVTTPGGTSNGVLFTVNAPQLA